MEQICRLCCSTKFVNNYIFDEENALYLKMSLYLPIKVFKNDRLPQKICDRCSCKVNDFYQFCNETIEVQNRLRAVLMTTAVEIEDSVDLTLIKRNAYSPPPVSNVAEQKIEPASDPPAPFTIDVITNNNKKQDLKPTQETSKVTEKSDQSTQTDIEIGIELAKPFAEVPDAVLKIQIKQEPTHDEVKTEDSYAADDGLFLPNVPSDEEDDVSLIQFQKKKKSKKSKVANGDIEKRKRKKRDMQQWDLLMRALPDAATLTGVEPPITLKTEVDIKQEFQEMGPEAEPEAGTGKAAVKSEPVEYHCCICFVQCYSRSEMLQHYREHVARADEPPAPAPPPPPDSDPVKCPRCQKRMERAEWGAHWARHWERDRRPLRCALCEKCFKDHHQILKHGLTHKGAPGAEGGPAPAAGAGRAPLEKRFVCDTCPESFVYMRHLLAHRGRAHPEAAARQLALRCALCQRQFAHLNSLRRHLHAHSGERNFLCSICGKALSSREHLKFHIRIHTGYKPNVCKTCGKGFVKKCNLTLHERVHSGERPHVCSHCGKAFSQRSTLVIHERYHSGARPYVCALCQRGFVAKGLLSMHLKTTCI